MARKRGRLLSKAKETRAKKEEQERLKSKHGIDGEDVVVVEKPSTFKYIGKYVGLVIRAAWIIFIFSLAFVGGVSLVYPGPKAELIKLFDEVAVEAEDLTGIDIKEVVK